jgi:hypothetical protein
VTLTAAQLRMVKTLATQLQPPDRAAFLAAVAVYFRDRTTSVMVSSGAPSANCSESTSARRSQAAKLGHQLIKVASVGDNDCFIGSCICSNYTPYTAGLPVCNTATLLGAGAHSLFGYCAQTTTMPYIAITGLDPSKRR